MSKVRSEVTKAMGEEQVKVASAKEVPPGTMKTFQVGDEQVLIANIEGKFYAMGAICTHQAWDLSEGTLEGRNVVCAGHGSVWNLETGQATYRRPLPSLPVYDVKVERDYIYVKRK